MSSDAQKKAYKKYNKKKLLFAVAYTPSDITDGIRLKKYLEESGQSTNAYLKSLIKNDLDSKNIPYTDN